jgi:hypothetical protein
MNTDKLNFTAPQEAMRATYAAISTLQDFPAHLGVIAAAILIQEMSSVLRIPVSELLDKADRITRDLNDHYQPEIKALREYIKQEMSK